MSRQRTTSFQATELELQLGGQSLRAGRVTTAHHGVRIKVRSSGQREIQEGDAAMVEDEYLCSQLAQSQAQSPGVPATGDLPRLEEELPTLSCVCGSQHPDQ